MKPVPALLTLEDGTCFRGEAFASQPFTAAGEVVFNTAMSGYQEVLTDPSYRRQIVCMAAPEVGNYGTNDDDAESDRIQVTAFLVRQAARRPSNWRARRTLAEELEAAGVPGMEGIDTRRLVRHLRTAGAMRGALSSEVLDEAELRGLALLAPDPNGLALVDEVTRAVPLELEADGPERFRVVLYDFGAKRNISRRLRRLGARLLIVPADTPAERALEWRPDGVMLSNGPGDPATVGHGVRATAELLGKVPVFGICLGHQLLGQAIGGRTLRLRPPGHQPAGGRGRHRQGLGHQPQPRLRGRPRQPAADGEGHPPQRQRRRGRGPGMPRRAGVLRAVPPGGRARPSRRSPTVRALRGADGVSNAGHVSAVRAVTTCCQRG